VVIDLRALHDLPRHTRGIAHPERTAARLAGVRHHAAHAHGTIEQGARPGRVAVRGQLEPQLGRGERARARERAALPRREPRAPTVDDGGELRSEAHSARLQRSVSGLNLATRDVVDVLQEHEIATALGEVRDQRAMSRRAEQQPAAFVAERPATRIGGERVGARVLLTERHLPAAAETFS
jgi:hypothetical protein